MKNNLVEVIVEDDRWLALGIEALAGQVFAATLKHLKIEAQHYEIGLLACDDAKIASLNAQFRDKPQPTNVLSWPFVDLSHAGQQPNPPTPDPTGMAQELGDIAISYGICMAEAKAAGIKTADHLTHLLIHGLLHLLGYDHISDPDAEIMQEVEVEMLGKLGISNPYVL